MAETSLQPVIATCQLAWRPTQLLLALFVRDAFSIPTRGIELPRLVPAVHAADNAPKTPQARERLAEQWYLWWRETLDAIDLSDRSRMDWSVLYGDGDHPELSTALDAVYAQAVSWLAEQTSAWDSLRENGFWGSRTPSHPTEVGPRWIRNPPKSTIHVAIVRFEGMFARQLRDSLFVVSWDLAIDKDAFDAWIRPILRAKVNAAIDGLE